MTDRMRTLHRSDNLEVDKSKFQEDIDKALDKIPIGSLRSKSTSSRTRALLRNSLRNLHVLIGDDDDLPYSVSRVKLQDCFDQALSLRPRVLSSEDGFMYTINNLDRDFYNDILGHLKRAHRADRTPNWQRLYRDAEKIRTSAAHACEKRQQVHRSEARRLKASRQWQELEKTYDYIQSLRSQLSSMGYRLSQDPNWRSLNSNDPYLDPSDIQALIDYLKYRIRREKKRLQHEHIERGRRPGYHQEWASQRSHTSRGHSQYYDEDDRPRSNLGFWVRT